MGEKFEDAMLLALKTEEGPRAKEYRQLLEAGKAKKQIEPLEPLENT